MDSSIENKCPALTRLRKGYVAACEIEPTQSGRRAWIGVYPLHAHKHIKHKGDYRLRVFEVDEKYLVDDNDVWDEVMHVRADIYLFGEKGLISRLEEFIDPTSLTDPQSSQYPV